jgi:hypothetical protein
MTEWEPSDCRASTLENAPSPNRITIHYDREILAVVETIKESRHYVEGANHTVLIWCDHKNLHYIQTSFLLSRRQARWVEILSSYDVTIKHLEGMKNTANTPSSRPDNESGYEWPAARLLPTLVVTTIELYDDLLPIILATEVSDLLAADVKR